MEWGGQEEGGVSAAAAAAAAKAFEATQTKSVVVTRYEGERKGFVRDGHGRYQYPGEVMVYDGEWSGGAKHGRGVFNAGNAVYEGEMVNGEITGKGVKTWVDGRRYEGEFRDGEQHGHGTWTGPDGETYTGDFVGNKRHGQGDHVQPNGERYVGGFDNHRRHGTGTTTRPDGFRYEGRCECGVYEGQGTARWGSGSVFNGEWHNCAFHGQGQLVGELQQVVYAGPWCNGRPTRGAAELYAEFISPTDEDADGKKGGGGKKGAKGGKKGKGGGAAEISLQPGPRVAAVAAGSDLPELKCLGLVDVATEAAADDDAADAAITEEDADKSSSAESKKEEEGEEKEGEEKDMSNCEVRFEQRISRQEQFRTLHISLHRARLPESGDGEGEPPAAAAEEEEEGDEEFRAEQAALQALQVDTHVALPFLTRRESLRERCALSRRVDVVNPKHTVSALSQNALARAATEAGSPATPRPVITVTGRELAAHVKGVDGSVPLTGRVGPGKASVPAEEGDEGKENGTETADGAATVDGKEDYETVVAKVMGSARAFLPHLLVPAPGEPVPDAVEEDEDNGGKGKAKGKSKGNGKDKGKKTPEEEDDENKNAATEADEPPPRDEVLSSWGGAHDFHHKKHERPDHAISQPRALDQHWACTADVGASVTAGSAKTLSETGGISLVVDVVVGHEQVRTATKRALGPDAYPDVDYSAAAAQAAAAEAAAAGEAAAEEAGDAKSGDDNNDKKEGEGDQATSPSFADPRPPKEYVVAFPIAYVGWQDQTDPGEGEEAEGAAAEGKSEDGGEQSAKPLPAAAGLSVFLVGSVLRKPMVALWREDTAAATDRVTSTLAALTWKLVVQCTSEPAQEPDRGTANADPDEDRGNISVSFPLLGESTFDLALDQWHSVGVALLTPGAAQGNRRAAGASAAAALRATISTLRMEVMWDGTAVDLESAADIATAEATSSSTPDVPTDEAEVAQAVGGVLTSNAAAIWLSNTNALPLHAVGAIGAHTSGLVSCLAVFDEPLSADRLVAMTCAHAQWYALECAHMLTSSNPAERTGDVAVVTGHVVGVSEGIGCLAGLSLPSDMEPGTYALEIRDLSDVLQSAMQPCTTEEADAAAPRNARALADAHDRVSQALRGALHPVPLPDESRISHHFAERLAAGQTQPPASFGLNEVSLMPAARSTLVALLVGDVA